MEHIYQTLPPHIQEHLRSLSVSTNITDPEEGLDLIAKNWIDKRDMFEAQARALDMKETDEFELNSPGAALILTYSGSLIGVSTINESSRKVDYYSIKLRRDVPDVVKIEKAQIKESVKTDQIIEFTNGPLQKTSAVYKITIFNSDVSPEEQETRLHEAIIFLTNGFVKINRFLSIDSPAEPGQFTNKSIISQIAQRNGLTQKQIKSILDDYWGIVESGVILGEKVQLGKIGKLYLKRRQAQKARLGKNFATGDEITIPAKPEGAAPKISFSNYIKEKSKELTIYPEN